MSNLMLKKLLSIVASMFFSASVWAAQYPEVLNITYVKAPFNIQNMVMMFFRKEEMHLPLLLI